MNKKASLQVQAVLYKNNTAALLKSLQNLANAVGQDQKNDMFLGDVRLIWGDASPSPLFTEQQICELNNIYHSTLQIKYVYFNENTGYGKGHNLLFADCKADYLMIENPDILIAGDYFHYMMMPFGDPATGLVEARQTPIEHPKKYNEKTMETNWSSGACFIISSSLFRRLEGFDAKSFFMYSEDVDLSLRIRREGKKLIYQPKAPVYHAKRVDSDCILEHTDAETRHSAEAQMALAYKWNKTAHLRFLMHAFESGNDLQKEAVVSFRKRLSENGIVSLKSKTELFCEEDLENRFSL